MAVFSYELWMVSYMRIVMRKVIEGNRNYYAITEGNGHMQYALRQLVSKGYVNGTDTLWNEKTGIYLPSEDGKAWWQSVLAQAGVEG